MEVSEEVHKLEEQQLITIARSKSKKITAIGLSESVEVTRAISREYFNPSRGVEEYVGLVLVCLDTGKQRNANVYVLDAAKQQLGRREPETQTASRLCG